jgi:hypothetical protein
MAIEDAPDGTLWVQQVNVEVDVPEPSAPPTYESMEDIESTLVAIRVLLTLIQAWAFATVQADVATAKGSLATIAAWAFSTLQGDMATSKGHLGTIAAWAFSTLQGDMASLEARLVPATELAAGATGRYSGTAITYQTVASWTVTAGKTGILKEITVVSSKYANTYWQVTVGAVTYATNWLIQAAIPLIFDDLRLAAASVVKVEAKSTDGTAIVADAVIVGLEVT